MCVLIYYVFVCIFYVCNDNLFYLYTGNINVDGDQTAVPNNSRAIEHVQAIIRNRSKALLKTRTLKGHPLNIPFSDIDSVIQQIKGVGIHEIKAPDVQFVLAVRAFPLVNNVISLWVFVGSLEVHHAK